MICNRQWLLGLLVTVFSVGPAVAQESQREAQSPSQGEDPIARALFAPELVVQNRQAIDLTDEQWTRISESIRELQRSTVDLEWDMLEASQTLVELLDGSRVDEAAALEQVDRVLTLERRIKRAQLALLIDIKNILTPEQQDRLRSLRGDGR
jgi:Spy/CpxP family protein refolding chaperone